MSTTKPVIVNPANTLKRRAERGRGIPIAELQKAADQVLESHTTNLRDTMLGAIGDSREMIKQWRAGGAYKALVQKLVVMAAEAEDQGRIYGNRLLTEVGLRLGTFMSLLQNASSTPSAKSTTAIELHLDAMIVALDRPQHDKIDEVGQVLISNLELTQRTIK